jgi:hypothetical protein
VKVANTEKKSANTKAIVLRAKFTSMGTAELSLMKNILNCHLERIEEYEVLRRETADSSHRSKWQAT